MNLNNKQIFIEGKQVTEDYLLDVATELTTVTDLVKLIRQPIGLLNHASVRKEQEIINYYIYSGSLSCLENNLIELEKKIQELSNSICPDENGGAAIG